MDYAKALIDMKLRRDPENIETPEIRGFGDAVVLAQGKVLVMKRGNDKQMFPGLWCVPGGHVDGDESYSAAAVRELREEAGIEIWDSYTECKFFTNNNDTVTGMFLFTLPECPPVYISDEHTDYKWATLGELYQLDMIPEMAHRIEEVMIRATVNTKSPIVPLTISIQ